MKNLLLLTLILFLSCKASQKQPTDSCCKNTAISEGYHLNFPTGYSPNCESSCINLNENIHLSCFDYTIFSRWGNIVTSYQTTHINSSYLTNPLAEKIEAIEHDGTYYFVAYYQTNDSCFQNKGYLQYHK